MPIFEHGTAFLISAVTMLSDSTRQHGIQANSNVIPMKVIQILKKFSPCRAKFDSFSVQIVAYRFNILSADSTSSM